MLKVIHMQKLGDMGAGIDTYQCTKTENTPRLRVGEEVTEDVVMEIINQGYSVNITPVKK